MWNKKNDSDVIIDYAILLFLFAVSGLLIRGLRLQQSLLLFATIPLSLGYVIWGVLHHKKHGHIDKKIILEYLGLALLVNVIVGVLVL